MAQEFERLEQRSRPACFAACDPPGQSLGSGGGTANLPAGAWQATGAGKPFAEGLGRSRQLILHGGGQSRRLPCSAPIGKLLMPIPVFRWARGQRLDQSLLEVQLPGCERVLAHAGAGTPAMVTSVGNMRAEFDELAHGLARTIEWFQTEGRSLLAKGAQGEAPKQIQ
jgi:hypothetical protein